MPKRDPVEGAEEATQSLPSRLPINILHLSDLHWGARAGGRDSSQNCWTSFLEHVTECRQKGLFRPDFIAFTGDLVHTPWPGGARHFRRGVNALLQVAGRCGFVEGEPTWTADQVHPPPAWWELLGRRLLMVPGNHDLYFFGVRVLWNRCTRHWRALSAPPGQLEAPAAFAAGPLAILLIDSNGGPRLCGAARGEVKEQPTLGWPETPSTHLFRIALMHGHPLQVPFLLTGQDPERLMLVNDAGLLLKNLAHLGVRLLLHGHRHYPNISTLSLPDSDGAMQPIVVVGAGSVTRPESGWPYYAYDWIRVHPDHRVEVTFWKRSEGERAFALDRTYLADAGDFRYDLVRNKVAVQERTGDLDVTLEISGFRVLPGRREVARVPLSIGREEFASLAGWSVGLSQGGLAGSEVRWDEDTSSLLIDPPHRWTAPPVDLKLRYFIHNGEALSRWEAEELYDDDRRKTQGSINLGVPCETGTISLQVELPSAFQGITSEQLSGRVVRGRGIVDEEASSAFSGAIAWDPVRRQISVQRERPQSSYTYRLFWPLLQDPPIKAVERRLLFIRHWQRWLVDQHEHGNRPLDAECRAITRSLEALGLPPQIDVSLFVPDTHELRKPPFEKQPHRRGALRLVGATVELQPPLAQWSLPYGMGVAGRAWRAGTPQLYHVTDASSSREAYEQGEQVSPGNFYHPFPSGPKYLAVLAAPILATGIAEEFSIEVSSGRFALLVLSIGSTSHASPLLDWDSLEVGRLAQQVVSPLERKAYEMAKSHRRGY
jgi:predicted phosphodiesterase